MTIRAAIYVRVPRTEQASNDFRLGIQRRACADYCRREGIEVDAVVTEVCEGG